MMWLVGLLPVVFITLPFWLPRALDVLGIGCRKQTRFLANSIETDPDWQLTKLTATHPRIGYIRLYSGLISIRTGMEWQMSSVERSVLGRAIRRTMIAREDEYFTRHT